MSRMRKPESMTGPEGPLADELSALGEANRLIGTGISVSEALRAQLGVTHELMKARTSYVALHDQARGLLTVIASRGRADARVRAWGVGEGLLGKAFETQSVVEENAALAVGFSRRGQPVGAFELTGYKLRPSDAALRALSASMGAALEVSHVQEELRQRKHDLEQANAAFKALDSQRDQFLGRVSHELKTPLTTVKTYMAMLLRHRMGELTEKQERALGIVDRNSDRLLRLIDDLLLSSRLTVGQMSLQDKPFGLKTLMEECWAVSQKPAERAQVTLEPVSGGEYFVRGDREHLRESVLGLLDNAIRYNRPGGKVSGRLSSQGATAVMEIADTGRGIATDKLAQIFEPFDAASDDVVRRRGAGSALSRVRQVMQLHGGAVTATSTPEGSTFKVTLPMFAGMVGQPEVHVPAPSAPPGGVLIVEDDDDCREGVQELLQAEGIEVSAVASSQEAIDALRNMRPALLLVDLRLREGDGRLVVSHVRATPALANTPVFVMSGAVTEASSLRTEGPDRIDGFFEKPLNLPRVLSAIRSIVRAKTAEQPS